MTPTSRVRITFTVNGEPHDREVASHHSLLDVLRDDLRLTGSKECCAEGECGACTVIMDGRTVNSCLVLGAEADGSAVVTVEGLADGAVLDPVQAAFLATGAVQCGFCTPGMVISARDLLDRTERPGDDEIREALSGNLCRCGCYNQICEAVAQAAGRGDEA